MAGEQTGTTTVEVEDDAVVTVEVPDGISEDALKGLGNVQEAVVVDDGKKTETKTRAETRAEAKSAADEAAARLKEQLTASETRTKVAEDQARTDRARAEEALRIAAQHEQAATTARDEADKTRLERIESDIASQAQRIEAAKVELKRAYEAAEFDKVADAQAALAEAASKKATLESRKQDIESGATKQQRTTTEGRVAATEVTPAAAFEGYVSRFAPAAAAWLRAHPECVPVQVGGDAVANAKMMLGHEEAKRKGYALNSADYFAEIERHIGHRKEEGTTTETKENAAGVESRAAKTTTARPSAPVVRDGGPSVADGARKTRSITLSEQQKEAARFTYPHLEPKQAYAKYAQGYMDAVAEGKIGRLTH